MNTDTELFKQLYVQMSEAILIIDPYENKLCYGNRYLCQFLGYAEADLITLDPSSLFSDQMPAMIEFSESILDKGSGWNNNIPLICHDGSKKSVEMSASLVQFQSKTLIGILMQDKQHIENERKKASANSYINKGIDEWRHIETVFQEIERENQLMLSAVGDGIYGVNAEGKTTFVNPAAEKILGYSADELVDNDIHEMIHHSHSDGSHYPSECCPIFSAFSDGEVHFVDNEVFWRKDGTPFPVEYTSTPIDDHGQLVGAVVIFRDISDRRQAEDNLRQAMLEVESLKKRLEMENAYLQEEIRTEHNYKEIVGNSIGIQQVIKQVDLVAPTDASVLIYGESGTGKELIARAIHESSKRKQRPFIRVNCAAIPGELFESEFFGHIKGAFTGATQDRAGRFELANGGTLFLDEVGEIPLELQSKLLRVLQEGQYERVGDNLTRDVDVRVIAATNKNLRNEIKSNRFREDLFFRLNVFPIECLSLRERKDDIPLLALHFLNHASNKFNKTDLRFSHADIKRLQAYHWPGNIRELQNIIERSVIVSQGQKMVIDIPSINEETKAHDLTGSTVPFLLSREEQKLHERNSIIHALKQTRGKIFGENGAADLLDIKPTTLASKITRLGINRYKYKI